MKQYQYSHLPGWNAERRVVNGCGGHVVLIDRNEAPAIKGTERWCLTHLPSGNSRCFGSRRKAMEVIRTLAVGVDNAWDILPFGENDKITTVELMEEAGVVTRIAQPEGPSNAQISAILTAAFPDAKVVELIEELIAAKKPDGTPDWPTREKGVRLMLSYRNGMPLKMEMIVHRNEALDDAAILERIGTDPIYRQAMLDTLQTLLSLPGNQKPGPG